jgi:hypothetical protein
MRSTPSARVSGAPRLPLALAASLFALGALVSSARAETMPTRDTMDSGADMLSAFARYEMDDAVIDLFDAETGVKLSAKSVAAVADSSPFDDQNDFDLGLFVAASDGKFEPGQTVNVSVCDFGNPSKCVKAEPYKGAPESYECGASDELLPETDFRCVEIDAETDDDGDLSLIEMDVEPVAGAFAACAAIETEEEASEDADLIVTDADEDTEDEDTSVDTTSSDESEDEDEENGKRRKRKTSRRLLDADEKHMKSARRKLAQARQASVRRRAGRSSRSVRAGGARGFTGGRARRGRSRGRG